MEDLQLARQRFMAALEHHNAGRFAAAEALYREAAELAPSRASVAVNLAAVLVSQSRFSEALQWSERALLLEPGQRDALHSRELSQRMLLAQAASVLPTAPSLAEAEQRAVLLDAQTDLNAALEAWSAVLSIKSTHPRARARQAGLWLQLGRFDEGIRAFHELLCEASDPDVAATEHCCRLLLELDCQPQTEQPRYEDLLVAAISSPWHRPSELAPLLLRRLHQRRRPVSSSTAEESGVRIQVGDRLLQALLVHAVLADPQLEEALVGTRRRLLAQASGATDGMELPPAQLELIAALAIQCHLNEYLWPASTEEVKQARHWRERLRVVVESGAPVPTSWLPLVALYFDLGAIFGERDQAQPDWPPLVERLYELQVRARQTEARLAAQLRVLGPIRDSVSRAVQAQYERHPYPRWISTPRTRTPLSLAEYLRHRLGRVVATEPNSQVRPRALVAGCGTGQQPLELAILLPQLDVLAVDLSRASLAYAARQAAVLGVSNIEWAQADLLELQTSNDRFALIEASGVLHHLHDPARGLAVLAGLLAPTGWMRIALYSELGRSAVIAARELVAREGFGSEASETRRFRQRIFELPPHHPARAILAFSDFYALSECRDLVFHVQEHRFTLPQVAQMLHTQQLEFCGFELPAAQQRHFLKQFPAAGAALDLAAWWSHEQQNPALFSGMYQFWVRPGKR